MTDSPLCYHRWEATNNPDPGPCQCQRPAGHTGAHRCSCGQERGDDMSESIQSGADARTPNDLRTRIAKALYKQLFWITTPFDGQPEAIRDTWLFQADIVIRELGLQQQWRADLGYDGYASCADRAEAAELVDDFNAALGDNAQDGDRAVILHRYVTEWVEG